MRAKERRALQRNLPADWAKQFAYLSTSSKVTCLTCGTQGYPGSGDRPSPWQYGCLNGHPEECPRCGARFQRGGLARHDKVGPDCARSTTTQHGRLQALLAQQDGSTPSGI